jgi:predicted TIM-barrel fold metal-dependent hydrolase
LFEDLRQAGVDPATWGDVCARHLETTQSADVSVVFGIQAAATGWMIPNEAVAGHVAKAPDRLVFFASIDPADPGFREELDKCHRGFGCRGIKLAPVYQGVHPLDPRYREIYAYCQDNGLPILIYMATTFSSGTPLEFARPIHMYQVARDFPGLKMVLAHMGHPWEGELIAVIRRNRNLFADVSALYYRPWQFYHSLRLAEEYHCTHKILFGSDFPFTTTGDSIRAMRRVNASPPRAACPWFLRKFWKVSLTAMPWPCWASLIRDTHEQAHFSRIDERPAAARAQ